MKGVLGFRTLFSGDITATRTLTAGVAELDAGGWLGLHRHAPAEIYFVLGGRGIVTLDGVDHEVSTGTSVYIPGDVEHGIRNAGREQLRFFYTFPVDSFEDVSYHFSPQATAWPGPLPAEPEV